MAFDITSVLKGAAAKTEQDQIVYLPLENLDPDPNNFYTIEGIDELAANIELIGLQQPIRVRPGADGRYIVVSGHRRRAACLLIRDGEDESRHMFDDGVPCIIDDDSCSDNMRQLRLIYANSATRDMSSADISKQAEQVEMLLYKLKEEDGIQFPGRMRDHVAQACKVSKSKLARLHAIRENLVPELLERFDRGEVPEETAYQLSRLPKQAQAGVETCLTTGKKKHLPYSAAIERIVRDLDIYIKPASCRSHAGAPDCTITNVHICRSLWEPYRDCKNLTPNTNDKGICCRDCNDRNSCSWACQECKDRRKLDNAVEKEKAAEREKAEAARKEMMQKQFRRQRQEQAQRIRRLTDELGVIDECPLPTQYSWQKSMTMKEIERFAEGRFGDDYYYDGDILPTNTKALMAWAEFLECSTDYLLGLTDDPKPASERRAVSESDTELKWKTGRPPVSGLYAVKSGVPKEEGPQWTAKRIVVWTGDAWVTNGPGVPINDNIYGWLKLPEG